jgi:hypothetical protein
MAFEIALIEGSKFARVGSGGLSPLSPSNTWMFCLFAIIASHSFIVVGHQSVSSGVKMGGSSQSRHFHCSSVSMLEGVEDELLLPNSRTIHCQCRGYKQTRTYCDHFASTAHPKAGVSENYFVCKVPMLCGRKSSDSPIGLSPESSIDGEA